MSVEAGEPMAAQVGGLRGRAVLDRVAGSQVVWIALVLAAMLVAFGALRPHSFATSFNLLNMVGDAAILLLLAVGMTFVIITSGIDLSVGGVLVFSAVTAAKAMEAVGAESGTALWVGPLVAVATGLAWGVLNGFVVAYGRIPALIVTLGTLGMSLGGALLITGGVDMRASSRLNLGLGLDKFLGVPEIVWISAAVTVALAVLLAQCRFGRHTYAIGSNTEAARHAGVRVERQLVKVYGLAGLLAGLAGYLSLAKYGITGVSAHSTDNLQAIAAVVIGGTSLFGGAGTVIGTVIGVFIPAVLQNGFQILGVKPFWQQVVVGAVLIVAVYLDQWRRRAGDH
ncbi:ABC transporter permease [Actinomadura rupiterrae]|uniref:ABC transporter permease n=1 Tax=Actinomadura rupiterrae TaxID=559627 RepID=UPI0020A31B24|nr:ABC transporter permease [Actinomadura rupiterrae]MCP2341638.1 ribose transport system permease protein [Actinomadura rupiterrae]